VDEIDNIYSAENIARSRGRAAALRRMVDAGELDDADGEWLRAADGIERDAAAREAASGE
jgi:hypothetical protein